MEAASSVRIKRLIRSRWVRYAGAIDLTEPFWQAGYYDFNLFTERKVEEKLTSMHQNPVRAGTRRRARGLAVEFGRVL